MVIPNSVSDAIRDTKIKLLRGELRIGPVDRRELARARIALAIITQDGRSHIHAEDLELADAVLSRHPKVLEWAKWLTEYPLPQNPQQPE